MGVLGALVVALAVGNDALAGDLTRLSIDELASLQVVTVSRRNEARIEARGAIHVITGEDIRRSGVTTLPEAVRLSPGVQSSRIDADAGFQAHLGKPVDPLELVVVVAGLARPGAISTRT